MRRTLLSVGAQVGASLRERKSPGDFPNPPGVSEGVKSYATCIFLRFFFDSLHIFMLFLA